MKLSQVAVTLYTTRDYNKTAADLRETLRKVHAIGYPSIQLSGIGPIDDGELAAMIVDEGLVCCGSHDPTDDILDRPEQVAARLRRLGCVFTAVPSPGGNDLSTLAAVKDYAARINRAGKVLSDAGITLTYHNHHMEFARIGGKTILEIIYDETDPRHVQAEIDTHWVQAGGGDPVWWCQRLSQRLPQLHMKDFGIERIEGKTERVFKEIGQGNLRWKEIAAAAEASGCRWYIVEQDGNWIGGDPFRSIRVSFEYLRDHLL